MGGARLGAAVLTAAVLVPAASGFADAGPSPPPQPPPDASAVDVYRESIPTSAGPRVVDSDRRGRATPLPPAVQRRLRGEGGRDAALLEHVATSAELGAPTERRVFGTPAPRSDLPKGWVPHGLGSLAQPRIVVLLAFLVAAAAGGIVLRLRGA